MGWRLRGGYAAGPISNRPHHALAEFCRVGSDSNTFFPLNPNSLCALSRLPKRSHCQFVSYCHSMAARLSTIRKFSVVPERHSRSDGVGLASEEAFSFTGVRTLPVIVGSVADSRTIAGRRMTTRSSHWEDSASWRCARTPVTGHSPLATALEPLVTRHFPGSTSHVRSGRRAARGKG
jgi:hypothetical protein